MKTLRTSVWVLAVLATGLACRMKQPPYVNHKLVKSQKVSEGCGAYEARFKMTSNIVGERYEFQKCLHNTYDGKCNLERRGDTVDLRFAKADGPQALYNITLDVNAYPRYHFLTIDGMTFVIVPAAN